MIFGSGRSNRADESSTPILIFPRRGEEKQVKDVTQWPNFADFFCSLPLDGGELE